MGNRQLADGTSYTPNNLNQYTTVGTTNYAYDPNGNLTSDGVGTYTYDAENRLTSIVYGLSTIDLKYDAFGRRISKTVNGTTTKFTWDGDQLLEELDNAGAQTAEYVYGPGIDEPIRMQRGTTKSYYLQDGLGSVTHLTNPNGQIIEQYTYDPYGKPTITDATGTVLPQSAFGNRYLFTGREYDQETGLYFNRARYYSPTIGRFLSRDPLTWGPDDPRAFAARIVDNQFQWLIAHAELQPSFVEIISRLLAASRRAPLLSLRYLYVVNNPLNWVDPLGLAQNKCESVFDKYASWGIYLDINLTGTVHFTTTSGLDLWIQVGPINLSSFKTYNKVPIGPQSPIIYNLDGSLPGDWYNIDWFVNISGSGGFGVTPDYDAGGGNQGNFPGGYYYP